MTLPLQFNMIAEWCARHNIKSMISTSMYYDPPELHLHVADLLRLVPDAAVEHSIYEGAEWVCYHVDRFDGLRLVANHCVSEVVAQPESSPPDDPDPDGCPF